MGWCSFLLQLWGMHVKSFFLTNRKAATRFSSVTASASGKSCNTLLSAFRITNSVNDSITYACWDWSIGIIAARLVAIRVWWFHTRIGEGSADVANRMEATLRGPFTPETHLVSLAQS